MHDARVAGQARPHPAPPPLRASAAHAPRRAVGCRAHLGGALRGRVRAGRIRRAQGCAGRPGDVSEHRQDVSATAWLLRAKRDAPRVGLDCLRRDGARGASLEVPVRGASVARHSARRRRGSLPPGRCRARGRSRQARMGRRHADRRVSRTVRAGQGTARADAGARECSAALARALCRRRPDG